MDIRRTLLNWRWWLMLPVLLVILPTILVDLALGALVTTGEEAEALRNWISRKASPVFRLMRAFVYGEKP